MTVAQSVCGYCTIPTELIQLRCSHFVCDNCANAHAQTSEIKGILKSNTSTDDGHTYICTIQCPICKRTTKQSARIPNDNNSPIAHLPITNQILHGTRICTTGFTPEQRHRIKKAIESCGGNFYAPLIVRECTHLIVLEASGAKYITALKANIKCVSENWIFDCILAGEKLDESNYAVIASSTDALAEEKKQPTQDCADADLPPHTDTGNKQALHETNKTNEINETNTINETTDMQAPPQNDTNQPLVSDIFSQLCFASEGYDRDKRRDLHKVVSDNGGCILDDLSSKLLKPDFVVSTRPPRKHTRAVAVSPLWVEWCIKDGKLYDPKSNPIFSPLPFATPYSSMTSVRIFFYGFDETDATALMTLSELLGSSCAGPACEKITHIITKPSRISSLIREYGGVSRYHLVSHEWLFECAKKGTRVSESPYQLEVPRVAEQHRTQPAKSPHVKREKEVKRHTSPPTTERGRDTERSRGRSPEASSRPSKKSHTSTTKSTSTNSLPLSHSSRSHSRSPSRSRSHQRSRTRSRSPSSSRSRHRSHSRQRKSSSEGNLGALVKSEKPGIYTNFIANNYNLDNCAQPVMNETEVAAQLGHILRGAKVYISKKIDMKIQTQLHDLISKIGGVPTWMYDNSVTHYIHEGTNNKSQEFLLVSSNPNQRMVHPMWLLKCVDMGIRVREDYFAPNANPRKTLQIVDLPSTWTLPDRQHLLDYKPKVPEKRKPTEVGPMRSFPSSFSSLENSSLSSRGSHPTPHPAKYRKGNPDKVEHIRHHSSPNFSSDLGDIGPMTPSSRQQPMSGASPQEKLGQANENTENSNAMVVMQNAEAEVEQFTVVLKALAERVQKMEAVPRSILVAPSTTSFTPFKHHLDRSLFEFTPPKKLTPTSSNSSTTSSKNSQIVHIDHNDQQLKRAELLATAIQQKERRTELVIV